MELVKYNAGSKFIGGVWIAPSRHVKVRRRDALWTF